MFYNKNIYFVQEFQKKRKILFCMESVKEITIYSDILGLESGFTNNDVTRAYLNLVKHHHPDKGGNPDQFRRVQDAYEKVTEYLTRFR